PFAGAGPGGRKGGGAGVAARDGLEAPDVPAAARDVGRARHGDVPDVAGGALGAAAQLAVRDDPGADAGGDLDEEHVRHGGPRRAVLAERHDVDVVVHEDRRVEPLLEDPGDVDVVPRGHDRRVDGPAGGV